MIGTFLIVFINFNRYLKISFSNNKFNPNFKVFQSSDLYQDKLVQ